MNNTKNIVLAVLLILQAGLVAYLYRPGQNQAPPAAAIIKDLAPESVSALTITDGLGKTLTLTLAKDKDWRISGSDYPADQEKIEALLKKFAAMKASRLVSQTPSSYARLKVADSDFNRKVALEAGGKQIVFYLGTAPSAKSIHLRLAGAKEVYQVSDLAAWEVLAEQDSWWQTKYVNLPAAELSALTIANAQGGIELLHDQQNWRLAGKPDAALDSHPLETLLNAATQVSISSYLPKDFTPKGQPVATITCREAKGGEPLTIQIWDKDKPGDLDQPIKSSASPLYAKVKAYAVKELLAAKADSLLAASPVPEGKDNGKAAPAAPAATAPPAAKAGKSVPPVKERK